MKKLIVTGITYVHTLNDFPTRSSSDSKSRNDNGVKPHKGNNPHSTLLRTDITPV